MRIALTCNFSPWSAYSGGGQLSTHQLASALALRGHDVSVVYTRPSWERVATPATPYALRWAHFFHLASRRNAPLRPLNALSVLGQLRRLHREQALDVVHGNGEEIVLAAGWARRAGVRVITTPRYPRYPDALGFSPGPSLAELARLWILEPKYLLLGQAVRASDYCCPTSRHSAEQVSRALGADLQRLRVVPNGVAPEFLQQRWQPRVEAPLLFFGRLDHDKGLDLLLEALALTKSPRRLLVVGRGPLEGELKALARRLGLLTQLEFLGWTSQTEVARLIASSAFCVLPSRFESFGNAMLECMAVGAPLISTRAGSLPEVVDDGVSGALVEPNDPAALAAAMQRFEADPEGAARLGAAARARVEADFSWDGVARRYLELYAGRG